MLLFFIHSSEKKKEKKTKKKKRFIDAQALCFTRTRPYLYLKDFFSIMRYLFCFACVSLGLLFGLGGGRGDDEAFG